MISVIIPSYNSELTIEKCLTALKKQQFGEVYEIILVDSSRDRTPDIVRAKFPDVCLIYLEQQTDPGTARNLGVAESRGDPILFIDSDCEAAPDWMHIMVDRHRRLPHGAVGGAVINGNHSSSEVAWAGYLAEFREFLPQNEPRTCEHIPTCNISYKREVFKKLNGFHPEYYPQEDLEFNYRLVQGNDTIYFDPAIQIRHQHRTNLSAFYRHQKKVGKITARMLKILPLPGATIARNRFLTVLTAAVLPFIKFIKTISIFLPKQTITLLRHPLAILIFASGLAPWLAGFISGAFSKDFKAGKA